ncbi:chemotaxis protein CheB [Amphritea sp. 1_MG-2023]|uniref:chemotaxis protein CheB n=1 Tax=Amphritea sp. 1_MG-2023 TaxID=3062670 RepID=UPI0026E36164|nr:chemotaxis protein CheB [Amphritea sp. 1_MG-2023]MDO6563671.1 chemotaxis protein CheB [Amphritea sp. 1_MG-2023]
MKESSEQKSQQMPLEASSELIVVGVGASAGGLEALQAMVTHLPVDTNMSFIIAQHLSPSYESMMVDLLEKDSTLPVSSAKDGITLKPNSIYVCPPNYNIELGDNNTIKLISYPDVRLKPRPSVDMLFESIALGKGEHAIGIVLSGTGSDGARGIRAIKAENGLGIVQDPSNAKYDGMPNSAINTGNVDLIVPAVQIGEELINYLMFPGVRRSNQDEAIPQDVYNQIIRLLKVHCKVDFSLYKDSTIIRRIERRMTTLKIATSEKYLDHLNDHPEEVTFLFNDMLIGVTSFYRDIRAFDLLREELTSYIRKKKDKTLRIWSVGCSTGEEPYTLAMMVSDILGKNLKDYKIQIFATDIDKRAIDYARNGIYPEVAIKNLPRNMQSSYLSVNGDQFEVSKAIKSLVIFSVHDINNDPPFLRLDLITCRNLMIYFTVELQRQLLPTFHYALNDNALLMLGQSESIGVFQEHYRPLTKTGKLYESIYVGKKLPPDRRTKRLQTADNYVEVDITATPVASSGKKQVDTFAQIIVKKLQQLLLPNAILLNDNFDIIYTEGKNPLLVRPEGLPTNSIYKNIHPQLSIDLRSAIHGIECGKPVMDTGFQRLVLDGEEAWVKLILISAVDKSISSKLTVMFCQIEKTTDLPVSQYQEGSSEESSKYVVQEQQRILAKTKEQLQDVIEELEASNEEMQSMNEELQSSNEELQSSNEELETTNEELQSTNEELQTAYSELRAAYDDKELQQKELLQLRNELQQTNGLLEEAERIGQTGSWLWDVVNRKMTWSRGSYRIFGLDEKFFHPSFEAFIGLAHPDERSRLEDHLTDMLRNKEKQPFIFKALNDKKEIIVISLEAMISFNDLKQAVKVMGSMTDITEKVVYETKTSIHKDKVNYILNSSLNATYLFNLESERVEYINPAFSDLLGYRLKDLAAYTGDAFFALFHPDDQVKARETFAHLKHGGVGDVQAVSCRFKILNSDDYLPLHTNQTVSDIDEVTGQVKQLLITFFRSEAV